MKRYVTGIGIAILAVCAGAGCSRSITVPFIFVVEPGFTGELKIVEDPSLPLQAGKSYLARQAGDTIRVPHGFLSGEPPIFWRTVETRDTSGKVLSVGDEPPVGEVSVRRLRFRSGGGAEGDPPVEGAYYFVVGKGE